MSDNSVRDTVAFMRSFETSKAAYVGKKISKVFDQFQQYKVPVRFLEAGGTSPWIDPEGRVYIDRIVISYIASSDMGERNKTSGTDLLYLEVEKPYMSSDEFDLLYFRDPYMSDEARAELMKSQNLFVIKDVTFYHTRDPQ
jgi:hypothetical protein